MTFKHFFTWYKDNAIRIFWSGFPVEFEVKMGVKGAKERREAYDKWRAREAKVDPNFIDHRHLMGDPNVLIAFYHCLFLFLTVPLGALIQTSIDCFTRKPVTDEKLDQTSRKIEELDAEKMDGIVTNVTSNTCYSSSSQLLKDRLSNLPADYNNLLMKVTAQKKAILVNEELQAALGDNAETVKVNYDTYKLDKDNAKSLASFVETERTAFKKQKLMAQKQLFTEFLQFKPNNGKKMTSLICKKLDSQIVDETSNAVTLKTI